MLSSGSTPKRLPDREGGAAIFGSSVLIAVISTQPGKPLPPLGSAFSGLYLRRKHMFGLDYKQLGFIAVLVYFGAMFYYAGSLMTGAG